MEIRLFRNWWLMTLKGLLAVGFGLIVIIRQYPLIKSSLAISFGIVVILSGAMIITGAFLHRRDNPRWFWWLIEGIIDLLIGAFFVFSPSVAKAFFMYFLALWAFALGVLQIITAMKMINYIERWWILLSTGILSIFLALIFFLNPFYTMFRLSFLVGLSCLVFGGILIFNSRILRNIYL
jgi:uncharacterized membrane protein HdeD (DUF308 family)